jgi:sugar phosphate isomerase/epimerase
MYKKSFFIALLALGFLVIFSQKTIAQRPSIGVAISYEQAGIAAAAGYAGLVENLSKNMHPYQVSEGDFQQFLQKTKALPCPIYAYNIFITGQYKLVGPAVNETEVLDYADKLLARLAQTNTKLVIWGSSAARNLPVGWPRQRGFEQFIAIAKKIAPIAQRHGIVLSLESLNSTETNFINTVTEALYVVKKVNHPNLRLNVDIYHMLMDHEAPNIIGKTKRYINHVEIAEPNGRTAPGVQKTDFRAYFKELKKINYQGMIVVEGRYQNFEQLAKPCIDYLNQQLTEAGYK